MRVGSLFAGIGGFDLAAERAGMEVAWQSEIDRHASQVLEARFTAPNYGDIHDLTEPPAVDVLTGGFPCQDYSVAGTRGGLAGDRGALWWEYLRLITQLNPTWVVGENVPGLLSSRNGRDFETIVGSLTECGYGVAWAVLDAQHFGVAQRRRRVFIVGHSGGDPRPEILALSEGMFGDTPPSRSEGERTAPTLAARTRGGGWPGSDEAIDGALAFNWQASGDWVTPHDEYTDALHAGQTPAVAFAQNQRDEVREVDVPGALAAEPGMKQQTYRSVHPTLAARTSGPGGQDEEVHHMVLSPTVRRLTPLECERLQGFPDNWTDIPGNSDTQRYRQLGNAVAVPVVEWIMRRIAA
jgi:DNA (cytosine-5)-methyltransferase 1